MLKELLRGGKRQIDAAMGAAVYIDLTAEGTAPGGIMEANAEVERHPIADGGRVIISPQNGVLLFEINAVGPGGSEVSVSHLPGDAVCLQDHFAFFISPDMLAVQVDLYIGVAVIFFTDPGSSLHKDRIERAALAGKIFLEQGSDGFFFIEKPAVVSAADQDLISGISRKVPIHTEGIVALCQRGDIFHDRILIYCDLAVFVSQPAAAHGSIEHFFCIGQRHGYDGVRIAVERLCLLHQGGIGETDIAVCIAACFLET